MRSQIEAELVKRQLEVESLQGQQQQYAEAHKKCTELLLLKNGAIQQLELILKAAEDEEEELDDRPDRDDE